MDIEILRPFGPSIVKVQLPLEIINQMNDYTDTIVKDQNKSTELDHGKKLVGNVQQEIVLEVEFMKKIKWAEFLASVVQIWVAKELGKKMSQFNIINSWIVRQFKHEYNPVHWHDGHISGVGYLKIPKFVSKNNKKKSKTDGTIDFINGNKMFLNDRIYNHQPKVGDVILFPNYLMHTAYPFKSSGERRSFSFNLEIDSKIANVFSR